MIHGTGAEQRGDAEPETVLTPGCSLHRCLFLNTEKKNPRGLTSTALTKADFQSSMASRHQQGRWGHALATDMEFRD